LCAYQTGSADNRKTSPREVVPDVPITTTTTAAAAAATTTTTTTTTVVVIKYNSIEQSIS